MRRYLVTAGKWTASQISGLLYGLLGSRSHGRSGILMFHRIAPPPRGLPEPTWNVTPHRFRRQLKTLLELGYRVWPLRSVLETWAAGKSIPDKTAVITFDDGYANIYHYAWPVLEELGVPATIFAATAYLDTDKPFPFDDWGSLYCRRAPSECWRPLSWRECREMEGGGLIEIGTHSHTHGDFRHRPKELEEDLLVSLNMIQEKLESRPRTFAFPYGSRQLGFVDPPLLEAARKSGVICALSTEMELADPKSDPFGWGRLEVTEADTGSTLAAKLEGWCTWVRPVKDLFVSFSPPLYLSRGDQQISAAEESDDVIATHPGH